MYRTSTAQLSHALQFFVERQIVIRSVLVYSMHYLITAWDLKLVEFNSLEYPERNWKSERWIKSRAIFGFFFCFCSLVSRNLKFFFLITTIRRKRFRITRKFKRIKGDGLKEIVEHPPLFSRLGIEIRFETRGNCATLLPWIVEVGGFPRGEARSSKTG